MSQQRNKMYKEEPREILTEKYNNQNKLTGENGDKRKHQ